MDQLEFVGRYGLCASPLPEHNHVDPRSGYHADHRILKHSGINDWYRPVSALESMLFFTWVRWRWFTGPRWGLVMFFTENTENESARMIRKQFRLRLTAVIVKRLLASKGEWFRLEVYDDLTGRLESEC